MFDINEYLREHKSIKNYGSVSIRELTPKIKCADGFHMSVQASSTHYCNPRIDDSSFYSSVEVGFPSEEIEELMPFAEEPEEPTKTVYGWVPVEIVNIIVAQHGGPKP
jgi:hypothetical protein